MFLNKKEYKPNPEILGKPRAAAPGYPGLEGVSALGTACAKEFCRLGICIFPHSNCGEQPSLNLVEAPLAAPSSQSFPRKENSECQEGKKKPHEKCKGCARGCARSTQRVSVFPQGCSFPGSSPWCQDTSVPYSGSAGWNPSTWSHLNLPRSYK